MILLGLKFCAVLFVGPDVYDLLVPEIEAVHFRFVEPGPKIDHTRGGVVVFPVVTKAGAGFAYLLAKGRVALAYYILA